MPSLPSIELTQLASAASADGERVLMAAHCQLVRPEFTINGRLVERARASTTQAGPAPPTSAATRPEAKVSHMNPAHWQHTTF